MTTETDPRSDGDEEQSFLPTILAGAAILAIAALLIFWPSDEDDAKAAQADAKGQAARAGSSAQGRQSGAGGGGSAKGVARRDFDAATQPAGRGRLNPAVKTVTGKGMAPPPEAMPEHPPANASTEDKIAFYEKRLEAAIRNRDHRKLNTERLARAKERAESQDNPQAALAAFERRKEIVQSNYEKAKKDVEDLEATLAELRGQ